jgi:hypothetical protein
MRRLASLILVVAAMLVSGATTAFAAPPGGNGGITSDGYQVVAVSFSGSAASGGGGVISLPVPATCWWGPAELSTAAGYIDPTNADQIEAWFKDTLPLTNGTAAPGRAQYGDLARWKPVLDKMRAGEKFMAFQPNCRQDAPACALVGFGGMALPPGPFTTACGMAMSIDFFPTTDPPAPQIAPADLAQVARDEMEIPKPLVDRNPKVTALGGGTLVSLPTWFWVTDPTSVGGTAGTRTIRAEVDGVWAQVVANTRGLILSSPAGGADCPPAKALTRYAAGVSEASACTVPFARSSVGYSAGFPVDASTSWSATWTGSGNTSGTLASLQRGTVFDVPVAEVQTIVTDAG